MSEAATKARKDIDEAILEGYSATPLLRSARSFKELAKEIELNADSRDTIPD